MCFLQNNFLRITLSYFHKLFSTYKRIVSNNLFNIPCTTRNLFRIFKHLHIIAMLDACVVGSNGIEPSTSRLSGVRSNHLSYEPIIFRVVIVIVQSFVSLHSIF